VSFEFAQDGPAHHLILDLLPIGAQRACALPPQCGGLFRCFGALNSLRVWGTHKFLHLEVMFAGGLVGSIELETVGREVGEAAVWLFAGAIKVNRHTKQPLSDSGQRKKPRPCHRDFETDC
jgi:hypothetical protein